MYAARKRDSGAYACPVASRPYVLLSCAVSIDGYLDDTTGRRLVLSNDEDLDRVDAVRAGCDAILVGANTIRRDDPRLLVRSPERQAARRSRGLPGSPVKVTLTGQGDLAPGYRFFTTGDAAKLVYAATPAVDKLRERLGGVATVLDAGEPPDLTRVLSDLAGRGIARLMVEGGPGVLSQVLRAGLADELHLAVAPLLVGDPGAPRFPGDAIGQATLAEVRRMGGVVLLRYELRKV
jgi:5-amino-6-(5-phosphoribosylamino)uracil reductase